MSELEPRILVGDVLEQLAALPDESVHCVVTSPPYWALRDYGTAEWDGGDPDCEHRVGGQVAQTKHPAAAGMLATGVRPGVDTSTCTRCGAQRVDRQLGLELVPDCLGWATGDPCEECYVCRMVAVFREVRRVLRSDGTVWLNIGDSYASKTRGSDAGWDKSRLSNPGTVQKEQAAALRKTGERHRGKEVGLKEKDLVGVPWALAFALRADGWWLRRDNIWSKRNPMPESTQDRTTSAHEYVFMLAKSARYFYDADAIREPAAWERWGDQTVPKHEGTATKTGWMLPKTKEELQRSGELRRGFRGEDDRSSIYVNGKTAKRRSVRPGIDTNGGGQGSGPMEYPERGRNKRSVWEAAQEQEDAAVWLAALFLECMRAGEEALADTVWSIATEPFSEAHFATFPTKLVEPCILAGTSERGVCPACGAPWERAAARVRTFDGAPVEEAGAWAGPDAPRRMNDGRGHYRWATITITDGWRPTCACYDDLYRATLPRPRASKRWQNLTWWERARARPGDSTWNVAPATVLDPFAGACTTLIVARRLNRASIGVELNPQYAEIGRRRLARWWSKSARTKPTPVPAGQLALLADEGGNP